MRKSRGRRQALISSPSSSFSPPPAPPAPSLSTPSPSPSPPAASLSSPSASASSVPAAATSALSTIISFIATLEDLSRVSAEQSTVGTVSYSIPSTIQWGRVICRAGWPLPRAMGLWPGPQRGLLLQRSQTWSPWALEKQPRVPPPPPPPQPGPGNQQTPCVQRGIWRVCAREGQGT